MNMPGAQPNGLHPCRMTVVFGLAFWAIGCLTIAWTVWAVKGHRPDGQTTNPKGTPKSKH
jgi:hypothetical protein